jgi:dihydrofolate reductase
MRKIVPSLFISLDGVVDSPQDWHFPYMNEEVMGAIGEGMNADTIVLGRRTYEEWEAFWAKRPSDGGMADYINRTPKLVASTTLDRLEWESASLIEGDVPAALTS